MLTLVLIGFTVILCLCCCCRLCWGFVKYAKRDDEDNVSMGEHEMFFCTGGMGMLWYKDGQIPASKLGLVMVALAVGAPIVIALFWGLNFLMLAITTS
jgi:hypothetical protein